MGDEISRKSMERKTDDYAKSDKRKREDEDINRKHGKEEQNSNTQWRRSNGDVRWRTWRD